MIFKKLKAYNKKEAEGAMFGFGCIIAMDYNTGTRGHLLLASLGFKDIKIFKLFIPF